MRTRLNQIIQVGLVETSRKLCWRIGRQCKTLNYRCLGNRQSGKWNALGSHCLRQPPPTFLADPEQVNILLRQTRWSSYWRADICRAADAIQAGSIQVHGVGNTILRLTPMNWYDYEAGFAKWVNRHDFVPLLVRAYLLSGRTAYVKTLERFFRYWTYNFSRHLLLLHDKPIDVSIRLLNWIWAFHFLRERLALDAEALTSIIAQQVEYIRAQYSPGGNHLLLEALAVYACGSLFQDDKIGHIWQRNARYILMRESRRQVSNDGVHTEQSTFYHQIVTTHFLKAYLIALRNGDNLAEHLRSPLRQMLDYVDQSLKPDLTHPMLGDGDRLQSDDREHWEAGVLLPARTRLFQLPLQEACKSILNDAQYWFLGCTPDQIKTRAQRPKSRVYAETGLAVLHGPQSYLLLDAAPFGDRAYPHHGHADALSVELCLAGRTILMDPGGYGYVDDVMRRYVRSTHAHSTVLIDGRDQSELFGVFGYGRLARPCLLNYRISPELDYVEACHDGYRPIIHRRRIWLYKGAYSYAVIIDCITGEGSHMVEALWQLAPDLRYDRQGSGLCQVDGRIQIDNWQAGSHSLHIDTSRGVWGEAPQGWVCPNIGRPEAATTLRMSMNGALPAFLVTVWAPREAAVRCQLDRSSQCLRVCSREGIHHYTF